MNGEDLKEITLTNGWGTISTDRSDDLVVDLVGGRGRRERTGMGGEGGEEQRKKERTGRAGLGARGQT
jgi:hypothetical protein